jgi:hypothetical protein
VRFLHLLKLASPPHSCLAIQEKAFSEYTESRKTEREERKIDIMAVFVAGGAVVRFDWNQCKEHRTALKSRSHSMNLKLIIQILMIMKYIYYLDMRYSCSSMVLLRDTSSTRWPKFKGRKVHPEAGRLERSE